MNWNQILVNPWIGFSGALFGILGVAISIIFFIRSRRFQIPAYYKKTIHWYDGKSVPHDDIKMTFRGENITRFTISHIAFWNAGNQTIRISDFASASPLRLKIPKEIDLYDVRLTGTTTNEIGAQISLPDPDILKAGKEKEIPVIFDYLDENDGFLIQIIHNGNSDNSIEFAGKLPGVYEFKRSSSSSINHSFLLGPEDNKPISYTPPFIKWLIILTCFGLGGLGAWSIYCAIFKEFHWYQIISGIFIVYIFIPFIFLGEISVPKALCDATSQTDCAEEDEA